MNFEELNAIYEKLDKKYNCIISQFVKIHNCFTIKGGYYNHHYYKDESKKYSITFYPIPVISVDSVCDIEINMNSVTVSTKLIKSDALSFDYELIRNYNYEIYGVNEYLEDYKNLDDDIMDVLENINKSNEREIGYSFKFDFDIPPSDVYEFVKFIKNNKFYY